MSEEALNEINKRLDETFYKIIDELKQEKQQLKEQKENEFEDLTKRIQENYDKYLKETNELIKENHKLKKEIKEWKKCNNELSDLAILRFNELDKVTTKLSNLESVLKEIRKLVESYNLGKYDYTIPPIGINDLLEIIDKGIGGE